MNIIDAVIIVLFIIGFLIGYRRGAIKQVVTLVGFFLVIILSYLFKDFVAHICFSRLPFIDFSLFGAVSVVNIIFYELISFLLTLTVLSIALKIIIKLSGIIEKIFDVTIILGFISKIVGGILGILEMYVITFILLFLFSQPFMKITGIEESKLGDTILSKTPILADKIEGYMIVIEDLYVMKDKYADKEFEYNSIEKFLKYNVIDVKSLEILKKRNKIKFKGLDTLLEKYGGKDENI